MKTSVVLILSFLGILAVSGCAQSATAPLPTLMPTAALPGDLPTAAPAPTEAATTAPVTRPTLPPTWTASPAPIEQAPTETPEVESQASVPAGKPTLEACGPFREDRSRYNSQFMAGSEVTVAWAAATGATSYRVNVTDEFGVEFFADYTAASEFTFKADLFERGKRYGWSVYPMDALGQQMCISVGGELLPQ